MTAFLYALSNGYNPIVAYLLKQPSVDVSVKDQVIDLVVEIVDFQ